MPANSGSTREQAGAVVVFGVSDFVAVFNQTLEYAYPTVDIVGELANFKVSKNRWVYFDLKDEFSSVKFFGSVYNLPGPLEDGLIVQVKGRPRLHNQFGFSVNVESVQAVGEGSLKRAAALLEAKLRAEGLFEPSRKRSLPFAPRRVGLIASGQSAAYGDFIKVLGSRWPGIEIMHVDTLVQGEEAPAQIIKALAQLNGQSELPEVIIITRGGGSADDLAAFNHEQLVREIAVSRVPTLVAIGHEVDISLSERAADFRASTPSNAAELLVPDKKQELQRLKSAHSRLAHALNAVTMSLKQAVANKAKLLHGVMETYLGTLQKEVVSKQALLEAYNPRAVLARGYAVLRSNGLVVRSGKVLKRGQQLSAELADARITAEIKDIKLQ